jgi:hypothetical protein
VTVTFCFGLCFLVGIKDAVHVIYV